jgi:signal transduction histidine kinase
LSIKVGELLAKTEEIREENKSLNLLNVDLSKMIKELKEEKQNRINSEYSLLIANDQITEDNEKFAKVNKELVKVSTELVQVHEQIKQYHKRQNEFINIISHELKTHIQSIMGLISILK